MLGRVEGRCRQFSQLRKYRPAHIDSTHSGDCCLSGKGRRDSWKAIIPPRIAGIPKPRPNPRPSAKSDEEVEAEGDTTGTTTVALGGGSVGTTAAQRVDGTATTCQISPPVGTMLHVVAPAHCVLAGQAQADVSGDPRRAYRHSIPAAHPTARRFADTNENAPRATARFSEFVWFVKIVAADIAPPIGFEVLSVTAKALGYTRPGTVRMRRPGTARRGTAPSQE
mmetsp:Transcript_60595/g.126863  ORF Transcript_60595/g.126863 Transcript_60595/m.126863 type:complete len:224 (+) Transcript_60595:203-874(+)